MGRAEHDGAAAGEVAECRARERPVEAGHVGGDQQHAARVLAGQAEHLGAGGHVVGRGRRHRTRPAQRTLQQRRAQAPRAVGAQQGVEARVRRRAERVEDDDGGRSGACQSQEKWVPTGCTSAPSRRATALAIVRAKVSVLAPTSRISSSSGVGSSRTPLA